MWHEQVLSALDSPKDMEHLYRQAVRSGQEAAFREAIESLYRERPDHVLLAAWHYRLQEEIEEARPPRAKVWRWAVPLAVLNGLTLWALSDPDFTYRGTIPHLFLLWAPVSALFVLLFLHVVDFRSWRRLVAVVAGMSLMTAYAYVSNPWVAGRVFQEQHLRLAAIHLVLVAATAVGLYVLYHQRDTESRFAFLAKAFEVFVIAGLYGIVLSIFGSIVIPLFEVLGVVWPDEVIRLIFAGGGGMAPVVAVAIAYRPGAPLREQEFREGISPLVSTLVRVFVAPAIAVLAVYLALAPFRFWEPFYRREVLIVYNVTLFAVVALLLAATPPVGVTLAPRVGLWLRRGLLTVGVMAILVSAHAFAAIIYRTWQYGWTPNRLTVIGWNTINTLFLLTIVWQQLRAPVDRWQEVMRHSYARVAVVYAVWGIGLLLALPLLF